MGWNLILVIVVFVLLILSFIQSACISRLHDRAVYLEKHVEKQEKNCSACVYSQKVCEGVFQCLGEKEIQYRKETDSCGWWKGSE